MQQFLGDVYAVQGKFADAARIYKQIGQPSRAMTMFTDLRMFDLAKVDFCWLLFHAIKMKTDILQQTASEQHEASGYGRLRRRCRHQTTSYDIRLVLPPNELHKTCCLWFWPISSIIWKREVIHRTGSTWRSTLSLIFQDSCCRPRNSK